MKSRTKRNTINFRFLTDGLHPDILLARKWLRRIQLDIVREAFASNEDEIFVDPQELEAFNLVENAN